MLPKDVAGDAVLRAIKTEMPHIRTKDWDFALDGSTKQNSKIRKGSAHEASLSYMQNMPRGEYGVANIKSELDLSNSLWKESIAKSLRDNDHPRTKDLASIGVRYVAGRGRGAKSRLGKL